MSHASCLFSAFEEPRSYLFNIDATYMLLCFLNSPIPQAWRAAKGTQQLQFVEVLPPCYALELIALPPESNILTLTLYWGCPC